MIKCILTILTLITWVTLSPGQNLAPNPSFEDTIQCPISLSDYGSVVSWSSYSESVDYYNTCNTDPFPSCGVPSNWYGYQNPKTGNAYYGMLTYVGNSSYREIIGGQLTSSLVIGQKYFASMNVCSANITIESGYGANKLGFRFTNKAYSITNPIPINNFAHIYSNNIVTDTLNWTKLFGSFKADSAYGFVAIGNFFDSANTDTIGWCNCGTQSAYYYIDDICISTDSLYALNYIGINELNFSSTYKIYPNPMHQTATLEFDNPTKLNCTFSLHDLHGQLVKKITNISTDNIKIERQNLKNGLYFFKLHTDRQVILTGKLLLD